MAFVPKNYVDQVGPVVPAAWLNQLDQLANNVFASAITNPTARAALCFDLPLEIINGGTAARDAGTALSNLGGVSTSTFNAAFTSDNIGSFIYPRTDSEIAAGVTPLAHQYPPGAPERYIAPGFVYAPAATGIGGTDFTAAINTALSCAGQPCFLGPHLYSITSYISFPTNAQSIIGQGIYESSLCVVAGSFPSSGNPSGPVISEATNASKLQLIGFTLYCNNATNASRGIYLGYFDLTKPYGTEGFIDQVMVRDLPTQALAFDINGNIGELGAIYALNTAGIRIKGTGNSVVQMENTAASGFTDVNGNQTATELYDTWVGFFECEAPATTNVLLTVSGSVVIENFIPSLAASTTYAELVYITNRFATWKINIPVIYYKGISGTFPTFTNLFYDQTSALTFGAGNVSNTTHLTSMCGTYQYGMFNAGSQHTIKNQQLNAFTLRVTNPAGTLQHRIGATGASSTATNFASSVNAASATLHNTPVGTGVFAFGGTILSGTPSMFMFDTGVGVAGDSLFTATITGNNTGTAYNIIPTMFSATVGGVTQVRLALQLIDPLSAAAVSWATALTAGAGVLIDVTVFGFFK